MTEQTLAARLMTRANWPWIQRWYEDETLDRELGPLDDEWLEYVLATHSGVQLVVLDGVDPVALVGCAWDPNGHEHGITDLAIDPRRRRNGLGRATIDCVRSWPEHPPTTGWVAFVDQGNEPAYRFFSELGWAHRGLDADGMHHFATGATKASTSGR
ncbi:GNAT family N-acetyltransferase [Rhodococcus baikonurensis]|uniref:GNAT family N-acetyltransferase n=1 Tax=Rhodococcus baikonurensis TaxID=172041 RepID=UPI0037B0D276